MPRKTATSADIKRLEAKLDHIQELVESSNLKLVQIKLMIADLIEQIQEVKNGY